jgi:phosphate transport system protein
MPITPEGFERRVEQLKSEMVEQVRRVQALMERCFEAVFDRDQSAAQQLIASDHEIDLVDVAIEKSAVRLLSDATSQTACLSDTQLREVFTVVKVNNEVERIADLAVEIVGHVTTLTKLSEDTPPTFRVLTNSVIGIVRDANDAYDRGDARLAMVVLNSDNTAGKFTNALIREAEERLVAGTLSVDMAFILHDLARRSQRMADHASNIAEQVIYQATGKIVRHTDAGWVEQADLNG